MAIYEYRCRVDGLFETLCPMGAAPAVLACPACGRDAPRAISAPAILRASRAGVFAAMDRANRSAHEPEVVQALPLVDLPPARRLKVTPQLMRLPRP